MKVALAVPHRGELTMATHRSILATLLATPHQIEHLTVEGTYVEWLRTCLVRMALARDCERLLFVDTDMEFEGDALTRMMAVMDDTRAAIVGVNYYTRNQVGSVSTLKMPGTEGPIGETSAASFIPDSPFECYAVGTGLMLVDLAIFRGPRALPAPWFQQRYNTTTGEIELGDDTWFCRLARAHGHRVVCDPRIPVGHRGAYIYCGQPETRPDRWAAAANDTSFQEEPYTDTVAS